VGHVAVLRNDLQTVDRVLVADDIVKYKRTVLLDPERI
jgi:hypothetical protein